MENSAPSLKIFRTKFSTSALYNGRNKNRRQNPVWEFAKTIIPFALVGYEVVITNSRYALVGYFITSYPTRANGIIVIYSVKKAWGILDYPEITSTACYSFRTVWLNFWKSVGYPNTPSPPFLYFCHNHVSHCLTMVKVWKEINK